MTDQPITLRNPELAQIRTGALTALRRMPGFSNGRVHVRDRLWIREPFYLPKSFDGRAPSQAAHFGIGPSFTGARAFGQYARFENAETPSVPLLARPGRPRFAREMLRVWHRDHLIVTSMRVEPLQAMTEHDAQAAGFADLQTFARVWDAQKPMRGKLVPRFWQNPEVLVIGIEHVDQPILKTEGDAK